MTEKDILHLLQTIIEASRHKAMEKIGLSDIQSVVIVPGKVINFNLKEKK